MSRKLSARPADSVPPEQPLTPDPLPAPAVVEKALPRLPAGVTAAQPSEALVKAGQKIVVWTDDGRAEVRTGYALIRLAAGDSYEALVNFVADGTQYLEIQMPTGAKELVRGPTNRCARGAREKGADLQPRDTALAGVAVAMGRVEYGSDGVHDLAVVSLPPPQPRARHTACPVADPSRSSPRSPLACRSLSRSLKPGAAGGIDSFTFRAIILTHPLPPPSPPRMGAAGWHPRLVPRLTTPPLSSRPIPYRPSPLRWVLPNGMDPFTADSVRVKPAYMLSASEVRSGDVNTT